MWCFYTKSLMSLDEGLFWGTVTLVCSEFGPVDFLGQKKKKKRKASEGNGNPLQHSRLENSMDGRAW